MAAFADHQAVVVVGIVLSGALIGNNNTLITEAVMGVAPVERPVASAAYSFVRFCGGAIGPYVALKLFGAPPDVHVHAPFWFGAAMVAIGLVILACGARLLSRTLGGRTTRPRSTRPRRSWSATWTEDVPTRRQPWRHDRKERRSPLAGKAPRSSPLRW